MHIKILIIMHGDLAQNLINTVSDIMGKKEELSAFDIDRCLSSETIKEELSKIVDGFIKDNSILILTDILGGTPTNVSLPYLKNERIEIVTGVNLPMVITAVNKKDELKDIKKLAEVVVASGCKSIVNCRDRVDI